MKTLVESCFHLNVKMLKKDLQRIREGNTDINGFINISYGNAKSVAHYYIDCGAENDYLVINYGQEEQRVRLAESELYFGARSWFVCDCDRRVAKLYLPPNSTQFKCRYCHKLAYELTTFNRNSMHGQLFYRTNRMIKLMNTREKMRSIFYGGKFTQRFNRFLRLSELAGLKHVKESADSMLSGIKK